MYGSILAMKSTSKVPSIKSAGKVGKRIKAGENASFSWLEGAKYSGDLLFYWNCSWFLSNGLDDVHGFAYIYYF